MSKAARKATVSVSLPRAEQVELARRAAAGDRRAADRLIGASRGFLLKRVRRIGGSRLREDPSFEDDLYNEASLGMYEALLRYDVRRAVHPLTYAAHWIDLRLRAAVTRNMGPASVGPVKAWRAAGYPRTVAVGLEEPGDHLLTDAGPTDEVLSDARELAGWRRRLDEALSALTPRERRILELRLLGDPAPTLREVGAQLGISRERARQVEIGAVTKLCGLLGIPRMTPARLLALAAGVA